MPEKRVYAGMEVPDGISKGEFKRQMKRKRMEETRETFLEQRREKRRAAHKRQRQTRRQQPQIQQQDSGVRVVLDCGFDHLMEDGERVSLAGQLTRCYSENRRAHKRVDLTISSFSGKLERRFDENMHATHKQWRDVQFLQGDFEATPNTVYLTGDADATLDELEPGHTYVVGGIVDKNRYKNLCLDKAREMGVACARLPIDEHIRVSGRRVLTTNQAFELLLRWIEFRNWKRACEAVIPLRKLGDHDANPDASHNEAHDDSYDGAHDDSHEVSHDAGNDASPNANHGKHDGSHSARYDSTAVGDEPGVKLSACASSALAAPDGERNSANVDENADESIQNS